MNSIKKIENIENAVKDKIFFTAYYYNEPVKCSGSFLEKETLINVRINHVNGNSKELYKPAGWSADSIDDDFHPSSNRVFREDLINYLNRVFPAGIEGKKEIKKEEGKEKEINLNNVGFRTLKTLACEKAQDQVDFVQKSLGYAPMELLKEIILNGSVSASSLENYTE